MLQQTSQNVCVVYVTCAHSCIRRKGERWFFVHSVRQPNSIRDAGVLTPHVLPQESRAVLHGDPPIPETGIEMLGPRGVKGGDVVQGVPGRPNHHVHSPRRVTHLPVHGAGPLVAVVVAPQGQVHPVLVEQVLQRLLHVQGDHVVPEVLLA